MDDVKQTFKSVHPLEFRSCLLQGFPFVHPPRLCSTVFSVPRYLAADPLRQDFFFLAGCHLSEHRLPPPGPSVSKFGSDDGFLRLHPLPCPCKLFSLRSGPDAFCSYPFYHRVCLTAHLLSFFYDVLSFQSYPDPSVLPYLRR